MVLATKLGEATGTLTTIRTLPDGVMETTFCGEGTFLGQPIKDTGTCKVRIQEDTGGTRLEGDVCLVAKDNGAVAFWKGFALCPDQGTPPPTGSYGVAGEFP